jgi:DNA-3-methyladenine glycosylase II
MNHKHANRHLATTDPRLAALIARSRRYNIKPAQLIRPFDALAESIAYQHLSGKAAATIFGGFARFFRKRNGSIRRRFLRHRTKDFAQRAFLAAK